VRHSCLVAFFALSISGDGALADFVCTEAEAIKQVIKLQHMEELDGVNGVTSAGSSQRKAIISGLATQYCSAVDAYPQSDYSEKMDTFCTLYSGVTSGRRVFWARCLGCGDVGVRCE
jgi:hypothetical protein